MTGGPELQPAGWYVDPQDAARLRYWDGQGWTGHVSRAMVSPRGLPPPLPSSAQPGWYEDPFVPTRARYWDGRAWGLQTYAVGATAEEPRRASLPAPGVEAPGLAAPSPSPAPPSSALPAPAPARRPSSRRRWPWIAAAGVAGVVVVALALGASRHHGPAGTAAATVTRPPSGAGRVGASSTTAPSTSTTASPAVVAWRAAYWDKFVSTMQTDRVALRNGLDAAQFGRVSSLAQAGAQLATDAKAFSGFPPIPDPQGEQQWQVLVSDLAKLAGEASGYDGSRDAGAQLSNDLALTASEQQHLATLMGWS